LSEDFNAGLFALFVVIVTLVAISNVWLRRRANRENQKANDETGSSPGARRRG
jgi:hypothetical protein